MYTTCYNTTASENENKNSICHIVALILHCRVALILHIRVALFLHCRVALILHCRVALNCIRRNPNTNPNLGHGQSGGSHSHTVVVWLSFRIVMWLSFRIELVALICIGRVALILHCRVALISRCRMALICIRRNINPNH